MKIVRCNIPRLPLFVDWLIQYTMSMSVLLPQLFFPLFAVRMSGTSTRVSLSRAVGEEGRPRETSVQTWQAGGRQGEAGKGEGREGWV